MACQRVTMKFFSAAVCALAWSLVGVEAVLDDLYCGDLNCYDVLGVASTAKPVSLSLRMYPAVSSTHCSSTFNMTIVSDFWAILPLSFFIDFVVRGSKQ